MNRDNTRWQPATAADIEWTADGNPYSRQFDDVYYSQSSGLRESEHVFLAGNGLPQRWARHRGEYFTVVETGFGTGLNFLACWHAWRQSAARPRLHFVSMEKYPLQAADLRRALANWPELSTLTAQLLQRYPDLLPGQHRLVFDNDRVVLDLHIGDVGAAMANLAAQGSALADAWFLDGFAPARNRDMWDTALLRQMAAISKPGATLATFTVAGQVRRGLEAAGFRVTRTPGFGRKREQLQARIEHTAPGPALQQTPWQLPARPTARPASCLVIGGGLAGCTTAAALAARGIRVTLLERQALASAASGNRQGVIYTRLSTRHSTLVDFSHSSFGFAGRYYRARFASGELAAGIDGELCGSFQQSTRKQEMAELGEILAPVPDFAQVLQREAASELLGIEQQLGGYWFPGSGWINPPALCRALVRQPAITVLQDCGDIALRALARGWEACAGSGAQAAADCAVVACGVSSNCFPDLAWLPLQAIRGQVTQLPAQHCPPGLRAVLCHEGYIAPPSEGHYCVGATFDLNDPDRSLRREDHQRNLAALATALPGWREPLDELDVSSLDGRVGYRCASPDYLPIVGQVPDRAAFLQTYAGLRKNARKCIPTRGPYVDGLFVNTAHGSRGLTSTPLAAELLASQLCGEPLPLTPRLHQALSPARFVIRDLSRNRNLSA